MSELSVGALSGLAANSYEIDIVSGSTLDLTRAKAASLPTSAIGTGGILQVVSTTKTDTFSATSTSFTDVTGLSATITPRSTSSKIMVLVNLYMGTSGADFRQFRIMRDATPIAIGDAASNRTRSTGGAYFGTSDVGNQFSAESATFLDSPNTTSAITYDVQVRHASGTVFVNRNSTDSDSAIQGRYISTITLMEVAG